MRQNGERMLVRLLRLNWLAGCSLFVEPKPKLAQTTTSQPLERELMTWKNVFVLKSPGLTRAHRKMWKYAFCRKSHKRVLAKAIFQLWRQSWVSRLKNCSKGCGRRRMTWAEHHAESEQLASAADDASRKGDVASA